LFLQIGNLHLIFLAFRSNLVSFHCHSLKLLFDFFDLFAFLCHSAAIEQIIELINKVLVAACLEMRQLHLLLLVLLAQSNHLLFQFADCIEIFFSCVPAHWALIS